MIDFEWIISSLNLNFLIKKIFLGHVAVLLLSPWQRQPTSRMQIEHYIQLHFCLDVTSTLYDNLDGIYLLVKQDISTNSSSTDILKLHLFKKKQILSLSRLNI